mmetsp:Transcript_98721/g.156071  ORF Transcript_98721/g.156071 Transcript_98721/m.156071 type:complete len:383 (-) Transcript_98721:11-1159(-)
MALTPGANQDYRAASPMGFVSLALKPDIDKCVERWRPLLQRSNRNSERDPAQEISHQVQQVEALWHHMTSPKDRNENNQYLSNTIKDVDARVEALEAELEAAKVQHRLVRLQMLRWLREQRVRAVGANMASPDFMSPAQESEIRLSLDHRKLIDLLDFDQSETCRVAVASTTAAVRERFEAQRLVWSKPFEDEKKQIQEKIQEVHDQEKAEQSEHEALIAHLMTKLEAHNKQKEADKARGFVQEIPDKVQGSLRAGLLGGASASSSSGASPQQKSATRSASRSGNGHPDLERLREIAGKPVSEGGKVKQWGATMVAQLGLNFYPSKPDGWGTRAAKSKNMTSPRVARSMEEALTIERESDESLFLSRFLLGSERPHAGHFTH